MEVDGGVGWVLNDGWNGESDYNTGDGEKGKQSLRTSRCASGGTLEDEGRTQWMRWRQTRWKERS
jgi:hypothetical protein